MPRLSVREDLQRQLRDHIAIAETHPAEECPLDVCAVAAALGVGPTTLYKYGFNCDQRRRTAPERMALSQER